MHKLLKQIKAGKYAVVAEVQGTNLVLTQLHYNTTRHKFYLANDKRGIMRRSISGWQAERLINNTLSLTLNDKQRKAYEANREKTRDILPEHATEIFTDV